MSGQPVKALLPPPSSKEEELREWRRERFVSLGFSSTQAGALARTKADYHYAAKMLDRGCTVDLAVRILL